MLEKTLQSPVDCKEIRPLNPKGNQPRIFTGRPDTEAEAPALWPPDPTADSPERTLMLGKTEGKRTGGQLEDEMIVQRHQFNRHELAQNPGSLVCCSPWCCRVVHDLATQQQKHN